MNRQTEALLQLLFISLSDARTKRLRTLPLPAKGGLTVYMLSSFITPKIKAGEHPLLNGYIEQPLSREISKKLFTVKS